MIFLKLPDVGACPSANKTGRRKIRNTSTDFFICVLLCVCLDFGMCTLLRMTGGKLIVECLVRHGVEVVFGIPGAHTMAIYDALYRHPKIKHILVRHEQSAALMADGYAGWTGKPGVCCVTTGPGVTNAATGLAVAHNDSIPVLLISSQVHAGAAKKRRGLFHAMDQLALTKSITKWNGRADNPAQIPERIGEALHVLSSGRRGAGHLEVPLDILQQDFELKGLTPPVKR